MKTKIATLILCAVLSMPLTAQYRTDGFFSYKYNERSGEYDDFYGTDELTVQGMNNIVDAPVGDALLIFFALSILYFIIKWKEIVKMKRMMLVFLVALSFTQCKKDDIITENTNLEEIPITMELALNQCKTYFYDIINSGDIYWGNLDNTEYFYLALKYTSPVFENGTYIFREFGVLHELVAETDGSAESIVLKGRIPPNYLREGMICELYYFGNKGNGTDDSNVKNIFDELNGNLIGKRIYFDKQTTNLKDMGDYHLASIKIRVNAESGDNGMIIGYRLVPIGPMINRMSIALLDLRGEDFLTGSATTQQSFCVVWNGIEFVEDINMEGTGIDVRNNEGEKSYVAILPTDNSVNLECRKGHYVFQNGIETNTLYYGGGNSLDEARPLPWSKP